MGRTILITGSTGQQGGATLKALVANSTNTGNVENRILALTRNNLSEKAKSLEVLPNVRLVQGDLTDQESIEDIFRKYQIDSVFSVQDGFQSTEVEQGKLLIDLAIKYSIKHFVYTSVDMSGLSPSPVPHFETKRQIEDHLVKEASNSGMIYTIIRPSAFFENFYWPPYYLSISSRWNPQKPFKHIGVSDIGKSVAEILACSGIQELKMRNRIINLTGDSHTPSRIRDLFKEVKDFEWKDPTEKVEIGKELTNALNTLNGHTFEGTPEHTKVYFPWVKDLREWLETEYEDVTADQIGSGGG